MSNSGQFETTKEVEKSAGDDGEEWVFFTLYRYFLWVLLMVSG